MSRFYLTLPSNSSMGYYPENTVAQYTTKLNSSMELEGDWEIGLREISFPYALNNAPEGQCYFDVYAPEHEDIIFKITLPSGRYTSFDEVANGLHMAQTERIVHITPPTIPYMHIRFGWDGDQLKVKMTIAQKLRVVFSPTLARILGFDDKMEYVGEGTFIADQDMELLPPPSIPSVYVYCDLVQYVTVGDVQAPLLRIANRSYTGNINVHHTFNPIMYLPLQKKSFDTVEVNLMTDLGTAVPFEPGKSFVVLEFRRAAYKYFEM